MFRRLFTVLSAASLLLLVATAVLWVRTYRVADEVEREALTGVVTSPRGNVTGYDTDTMSLQVARGSLLAYRTRLSTGDGPGRVPLLRSGSELLLEVNLTPPPAVTWTWSATPGPDEPPGRWYSGVALERFGFYVRPDGPTRVGEQVAAVGVPLWSAALAFALLPANRAFKAWRRRRPPPGLCRSCHYDLRATPDRCPECGMPTLLKAS